MNVQMVLLELNLIFFLLFFLLCLHFYEVLRSVRKKVQVGNDQEKAQSEKDSHKPRWEKNKLSIRYLYHETYRKPNEQLFSQ